MDKQKLIDFFEKNKNNMRFKKDEEECKEIVNLTSFLDDSYKLSKITFIQRIWHIKNDFYEIKTCKVCQNQIKWRKDISDYNKICNNNKCKSEYYKTEEYQSLIKKSFVEEYGVDNPAKLKEIQEKSKQTCLERYGSEIYPLSKTALPKIRKKLIEKYGVDNPLKSKEIYEKSKKTIKSLYGSEIYFQTKDFLKKSKQTCLERYGVDSHSKTNEFKKLFLNNIKNDLVKNGLYNEGYRVVKKLEGSNYILYCPHCKKEFEINVVNLYWCRLRKNQEICTNCNPLQKNYSCGEKEVLDYVKSIYSEKIIENTKKIIYPYELDIYLPELNLAIEFNGDFWHANPDFYNPDDTIISKNIKAYDIWQKDIKKIEMCDQKGIILLVVWENDWINNREKVQSDIQEAISALSNQ